MIDVSQDTVEYGSLGRDAIYSYRIKFQFISHLQGIVLVPVQEG